MALERLLLLYEVSHQGIPACIQRVNLWNGSACSPAHGSTERLASTPPHPKGGPEVSKTYLFVVTRGNSVKVRDYCLLSWNTAFSCCPGDENTSQGNKDAAREIAGWEMPPWILRAISVCRKSIPYYDKITFQRVHALPGGKKELKSCLDSLVKVSPFRKDQLFNGLIQRSSGSSSICPNFQYDTWYLLQSREKSQVLSGCSDLGLWPTWQPL